MFLNLVGVMWSGWMFCHVALNLCPEVRIKPFGFLTWDNVKLLELSMDRTNKTEKRREKHNMKLYTLLGGGKMNWIDDTKNAINFIENNLLENINADDVSKHINSSTDYFQRTFSIVTGLSISEYIRNRRLTQIGRAHV